MIYYNQYDYSWCPYNHPSKPNATIASSGCGVCCMAMVVQGVTGQKIEPPQMARFAQSVGARAATGTDMAVLSRRAAEKFGMTVYTTNNISELADALSVGKWAIVNVGGNRYGYKGLFSNGGHYVVACGMRDNNITILDPAMYTGKFNKVGRRGKVKVDGNKIYVSTPLLNQDCEGRNPKYYIFEDAMTKDEVLKIMEEAFPAAFLDYQEALSKRGASDWAENERVIQKAKAAGISDGSAPQKLVTREEVMAMITRQK